METKKILSIVFFLQLVFSIQLFSQGHTMTKTPQIEKSIQLESYDLIEIFTDDNSKDYSKQALYISGKTHVYETKTGYKFDLSDIPSGVSNLTAYLEAYRSSGSDNSKIVLMANNTNFGNRENVFDKVGSGSNLFTTNTSSGVLHNVTSHVSQRLSQGYINFGVKEYFYGYKPGGKITIKLHIDFSVNITAKNNFNGGSIKVGVNSSPSTKGSPYNFTANVGSTVNLRAVEQTHDGYYKLWNDTEAPSNKSKWTKHTSGGTTFKSNNISYSFTAATNDGGASYVANLRKRCNQSFTNNFIGISYKGNVTVNGNSYSAPTSDFGIVELNSISFSSPYFHTYNYIDYYFNNWNDGNTSNSRTVNPTAHYDYVANYTGKASNSNRNLHFNTSDPEGTPVEVMWNQHPNSNVTKYEIWRKIGFRVTATPHKIATINRTGASSYTYTDYDIGLKNSGNKNDEVSYDVKSYYSTEGTLSIDDYSTIYGELLPKKADDEKDKNTFAEVLEYGMSNYPNPFNPTTTIHYQLPEDANVSIKVFDVLGKQVAELVNGTKGVGKHNVMFNSSNLSAGLYFYTIEAKPTNLNGKGFNKTNKMLLVK